MNIPTSPRRPKSSAVVHGSIAVIAALALITGCASYTPEERAAIEKAWAERDRERAAECAQRGGRYISSSCVGWGGP